MASFLPLSLFFLILCHGSMAQIGYGEDSQHQFESLSQCQLQSLSAQEYSRRVESEAGFTDYFDQNNDQFRCAGVSVLRRTILPGGLLLPSYSSAPGLVYIERGRGMTGILIPGCPNSFQSFQERKEQGQAQSPRDQHQRITRFDEGDIIAVPEGIAHWCYNDGDSPVVAIVVQDNRNNANQLDPNTRHFFLAGSQQRGQQQPSEKEQARGEGQRDNIFSGFELDMLAQALGISKELARKLQGQEEEPEAGEIVRVKEPLRAVIPPTREQERFEEHEDKQIRTNGLEQAFCSIKFRGNIGNPARADVYNPHGGRLTSINSQKLPILRFIQMSAKRVLLYRNAYLAPHWTINAHKILYVTGGRARVQIVGNQGRRVFDGELRQGQLLIVPQNFALVKQASDEGFECVDFMTSENAIVNQIGGRDSYFQALPVDVIQNAYSSLSRDEARRLKSSQREHVDIVAPSSRGTGREHA